MKTIIYSILLSVNFLIGQAQSTKSPSEFWFSLSSKEKISFINGAYSALSVLKKKHKEEVAKQYLNDRNWIEPYYIERYYSLIDEYSSEFVGYDLQLITMHMDALYTNSDNINIPVLELSLIHI